MQQNKPVRQARSSGWAADAAALPWKVNALIIIMASRNKEDVEHVIQKVEALGYRPHVIEGVERTVIAAVGDERGKERRAYEEMIRTR